ncbi:hypothetical protein ACFWTE_04395 [Nocardiopsis sp. NPDC058631]|uniref:hypothetical protein n=1 Tax=Nocardiopsis sp. NPDC058631 TaxID=3346566 RepID=UPI00364BF456
MNAGTVWALAAATAVLLLGTSGCAVLPGSGQETRELAGYEVVHEMSGDQLEELAVPTTVSEASWVWEGPRAGELRKILPVPTGAVLHLTDGAVGLDPTTGKETWSYGLLESEADVAVSPDGSLVAVSAGGTLALLDSGTGVEVRVIEHGSAGADHLSVRGAGLVTDDGLVTAEADGPGGVVVSFAPWDDGPGWRNGGLRCPEGTGDPRVEDGFLTPSGVVVVYSCGGADLRMAGLDTATGEEQWSLVRGEDFDDGAEHPEQLPREGFAAVGDVAVLENMALLRGTVVVDTVHGEVLAEALPSEPDDTVLRVLPHGYLAVRSERLGNGEWEDRFEVRDFSGSVRSTVVTDENKVGSTVSGQLPLEDSFLKPRWSEEEDNMEVAVFDWDAEGSEKTIALPVEIDLSGIDSIWKVEEALGPGTFQEVPGAVLVREHARGEQVPRVAGLT